MQREHVSRVRSGEVEVELHASAFAPAAQPDGPAPKDLDRCECTHSLAVEHTDVGCLKGCPAELCARTGNEIPEARA